MNTPEISDLSSNEVISEEITHDTSKNKWTKKHFEIIKHVCSQTNLNEDEATRGLIFHKGDYKKVIEMSTIRQLIGIVMRQTTYTFKEAFNKLREHQGEPVNVIKEFMGTLDNKKKTIEATTTNQKVFSEIRNFMDDVNKGYDNRKKRTEQIKKIQEAYIEKMKN